ncbi:hypothetical protein THAOC_11881, partial [Thalassiosira oceanica]
ANLSIGKNSKRSEFGLPLKRAEQSRVIRTPSATARRSKCLAVRRAIPRRRGVSMRRESPRTRRATELADKENEVVPGMDVDIPTFLKSYLLFDHLYAFLVAWETLGGLDEQNIESTHTNLSGDSNDVVEEMLSDTSRKPREEREDGMEAIKYTVNDEDLEMRQLENAMNQNEKLRWTPEGVTEFDTSIKRHNPKQPRRRCRKDDVRVARRRDAMCRNMPTQCRFCDVGAVTSRFERSVHHCCDRLSSRRRWGRRRGVSEAYRAAIGREEDRLAIHADVGRFGTDDPATWSMGDRGAFLELKLSSLICQEAPVQKGPPFTGNSPS